MQRIAKGVGAGVLACAVAVALSACGGKSDSGSDGSGSAKAAAANKPKPKPKPTYPSGPPMLLDSMMPGKDATVGVAMPISIVFTKPVNTKARADIEKHLKVTTSQPVTGAWHWFSAQRVDYRPQNYWPTGTKVTVDAQLNHVGDGNGNYGTHDYLHRFTVGDKFETKINVPGHTLKVLKNGSPVKTMPIDAGSPQFPSWDGTMAIMDKAEKIRMKSCSVGIACNKSDPNYYDDTYPWAVHLTSSGTYIHYSNGDPQPGHGNGSHGCVHLSLSDAEWYFKQVKQGDPVTITGSPRGKAPADNGYASYNMSWSQWKAGSALQQG